MEDFFSILKIIEVLLMAVVYGWYFCSWMQEQV